MGGLLCVKCLHYDDLKDARFSSSHGSLEATKLFIRPRFAVLGHRLGIGISPAILPL